VQTGYARTAWLLPYARPPRRRTDQIRWAHNITVLGLVSGVVRPAVKRLEEEDAHIQGG